MNSDNLNGIILSDNECELELYLAGNMVGNELSFITYLKSDYSGDLLTFCWCVGEKITLKRKSSYILQRKDCEKLFTRVREQQEQGFPLKGGEAEIEGNHNAGWAFFLLSNLNLPWHNLRLFPLILSLVNWEKRPSPTSLQPPFR